jgi:hypothetical protein
MRRMCSEFQPPAALPRHPLKLSRSGNYDKQKVPCPYRKSNPCFPAYSSLVLITMPRLALGPTQPPLQWVPGTLSMEVKWPRCKADHQPTSNDEVKNAWSYTSTPLVRLHGVVLS